MIDLVAEADGARRIWCQPKKTLLHVGAYIMHPEAWVKRFEEAGLSASLRRGNKAARVVTTAKEFAEQKPLFEEFVRAAVASEEDG